jgi:hypothetical protein
MERIEELRAKQPTKAVAKELQRISLEIGGPKTASCFCTSTDSTNYITQFFEWYDTKDLNTNVN